MPRRRRNRKNRKRQAKHSENDVMKTVVQVSPGYDLKDVNDSLESKAENLEVIDQLRTPSPQNFFPENDILIKTTPVNRNRSNRDRKSMYESFNITNLNILFQSDFNFSGIKSGSDVCLNKSDVSPIKRSQSSSPKLLSSYETNPVRVNQSTQTNTNFDTFLKNCNEIIETPKMSRVYLLEETPIEKPFPIFKLKTEANKSKKNVIYGNEVNINPYLKKEFNLMRQEGIHRESSFFSPISQIRSSSTPIEILRNATADNVVDCSFNIGKLNNQASPITPKFEASVNLNNFPVSDKVKNKEDSIRSLRLHTFNVSRRKSYNSHLKSPTSRINGSSKISNRSRQLSYSILDISQRSLVDITSRPSNRMGTCQKVFMRLKKYCEASQNWSTKIFETCAQLGLQLKNSLSSLCTNDHFNSINKCGEEARCRCEEYRQEICNLNVKINELSEEMKFVKSQIDIQKNYKTNIEHLNDELQMIKEEMKQFKELRSELESVKDRISCMKSATPCTPMIQTALSMPPLPPPPPPPPPPLPPSEPLVTASKLKIAKKTTTMTSGKENSRPVISLDDILKVKLKKCTDRNYQTPANRRSTQPVVSLDMLKQVKLRPASRNSIHSETSDCTPSSTDLPTSPHSSLCRLLKNDCPTTRRNMLAKRDRADS
ncbi:uncharacterized protein isoform X2 [Leptinotarsa decemlineata]|uniref:uncharacterized protein isoform X2 n=1 Tax=Leptinotarsa decemlineata TaxID=7539 RepID=UPI003D30AF87